MKKQTGYSFLIYNISQGESKDDINPDRNYKNLNHVSSQEQNQGEKNANETK